MDGELSPLGCLGMALVSAVVWWAIPAALGIFDDAPLWRCLLLGWLEIFISN